MLSTKGNGFALTGFNNTLYLLPSAFTWLFNLKAV